MEGILQCHSTIPWICGRPCSTHPAQSSKKWAITENLLSKGFAWWRGSKCREIILGSWRQDKSSNSMDSLTIPPPGHNFTTDAKHVRDTYKAQKPRPQTQESKTLSSTNSPGPPTTAPKYSEADQHCLYTTIHYATIYRPRKNKQFKLLHEHTVS